MAKRPNRVAGSARRPTGAPRILKRPVSGSVSVTLWNNGAGECDSYTRRVRAAISSSGEAGWVMSTRSSWARRAESNERKLRAGESLDLWGVVENVREG